jgi:hypothetical protein
MNAEATAVANEAKTPAKSAEVVKMTDGREVEFAGKRKLLKESVFNEDGTLKGIRLDFRNGETRFFVIPDGLFYRFAAHGAEQKLGDETAGIDDVDDQVLEVDELIERLNKGEWNVKREGGGMAGTSVLLKALVEFSGKTAEQVKEFLKNKSQAEKLGLRSHPEVKKIIDRIESEKLAKNAKVDTGALLASLAG